MLDTPAGIRDAARLLESRTNEGRPDSFFRELGEILPVRDRNRISLRRLFESFVQDGRELVHNMQPGYHANGNTALLEAGDSVNTGNFSNIIGQITYSSVMANLETPDFIGQNLVTTVPATTQEVEVIPGISMIGDVAEDVGEGRDYPVVGVSEEFVTAPRKVKDGFILPITEEAIWEDKTGLLMQRVNAASQSLGITLEREILDTILGVTTSYSRNGGAAQSTYGNTHTNGTFDNLSASTALANYTDIEDALKLFDAIADPNTGDPIMIGGNLDIIVPTALEFTALNIMQATNIQVGDTTSATVPVTVASNPLIKQSRRTFNLHTSAFVKDRTSSATTWFIGNSKGAFEYREVWPIQVFRADRNSDAGFNRDVVTAVKVRRKGAPAIVEPRYMVKCTA